MFTAEKIVQLCMYIFTAQPQNSKDYILNFIVIEKKNKVKNYYYYTKKYVQKEYSRRTKI